LDETDTRVISAKFHNTLVAMMVAVAARVGERNVVLTGGCFQNRTLLEKAVSALSDAGFIPYWQQNVPPNDGGIALGQIAAVVRSPNGERNRSRGAGSCA
jgi:hydrogenase maturation protein HypF